MKTLSLRLACLVALSSLLRASAAVLCVDVNGTNPVPPYADWATAATNIQDAVDAAAPGDQVLVTNGVYQTGARPTDDGRTNRLVVDKPITVQSVNGQAVTLIEGAQLFRCVYLTNAAIISGFTLTNGTSGSCYCTGGGGVFCASTNEQVLNCLLINNSAGWEGAGVYCGTLSNCTFVGNAALNGGGGAAYSMVFNCAFTGNTAGFSGWGGGAYNATLFNCTISGGSAGWYGGGAAGCALNSCVIKNNTARYGGGGAVNSTLNNCTLTGNRFTESGGSGGGVGWSYGSGVTEVNNCILYNNVDLYGSPNNYSGGGNLNYCCTTPLPAGPGNFTDDPSFVNYAGGDLHLASNSLCINTGGDSYSISITNDLDGNPRRVGAAVDVGAYEYQSVLPVPVAPSLQASWNNVVTGYVVAFTGQIGGRPTSSRWEFGDGTIVSNQLPNISHTWALPGNYAVGLRAYNASYPDGLAATVTVQVTAQSAWYVRATNTHPAFPYATWATAATNIQTAVDAAAVGAMVVVSNGVYQTGGRIVNGSMSNRVAVTRPMTVQSLNGAGVTLIQGFRAAGPTNGNSNVRCAYLANGAVLAGFTLTNGATRGTGDSTLEQSGGGVWCQLGSAIISNCVLVGNWATNYGGGVYQGTLNNCSLAGNTAYFGGGAYNAVLNNCIVISNTAVGPGIPGYNALGGGVYLGKLWNCLLAGNWASQGGGAYNSALTNCTLVGNTGTNYGGGGYSSTLRNCVMYYNISPNGSNYAFGSESYCCAAPLAAGTGNFTNAPLFVDFASGNLRLQSNSPCINTGANASVAGITDLDGRPRVVGGNVDIGAYELQGAASGEFIGWLQNYGIPTDGSADFSDTDGDRLNNWQEWICGTNPTNALSVLKVLTPSNSLSGLRISWQSVTGKTYYVERGTDLLSRPAFYPLQSNIPGQAGTTSFFDTSANAGPYFYRIGVQ